MNFSAGTDFDIFIQTCNGREFVGDDGEWLGELYWMGGEYFGDGFDIGAHQHAANSIPPEYDFAVFCSTQVHFHREGWLKRMVEAREQFGPGLYGAMASRENHPHLRTCFFGCDPADFRAYPWVINSKALSLEFESGKTGFWTWIRANGRKEVLVAWDGFYDERKDWRKPDNIFRRGDQSNCLVWDRHTELYAKATPEEKAMLEQLADGMA
jgi:hypothetical protein